MYAINQTDGYKIGHKPQMPKGAVYQLNNMTPRKTRRENVKAIVWFGLQYFIKRYLIKEFNDSFFNIPRDIAVARYKRRIDNYLGPNHGIDFEHIGRLHDLGFMPILIKALPEGSIVDYKVPPVTIENTIDEFVWLVGYLETLFSCVIWGPCTSATTALEYRKLLTHYANETVGNDDFVKFQGHDFSFRGMFGPEAAAMSGAGHLLSFVGTDTIPAIDFLEDYYGANSDKELVGCSVAATEHSVMCLGTGLYIYDQHKGDWTYIGEAEYAVFKRLITEVCPTGIISIVSDTFNLWEVLNKFLPMLKEEIMARDGKVVIRPDSGDPVDILTGKLLHDACVINSLEDLDTIEDIILNKVREETPHGEMGPSDEKELFFCNEDGEYYWISINNITWNRYDKQYYYLEMFENPKFNIEMIDVTTEHIGVVEALWDIFGGTETEKGYKLLDSHIGCIYGDSITIPRAKAICERLKNKGFASINWVAGIGSFTYQYVTRDTDGWAIKATYGEVIGSNGERLEIPIFKDPITDDGTKKSARGLIQVIRHIGGDQMANKPFTEWFELKDQVSKEEMKQTALETVFNDGMLVREQTLAGIRVKVDKAIKYN